MIKLRLPSTVAPLPLEEPRCTEANSRITTSPPMTSRHNDTYPVWYAQEVEGVRQDVTVVNLMLANTDWYLRQLARATPRSFDPAAARWYGTPPAPPSGTLLDAPDSVIARLAAFRLDRDVQLHAGHIDVPFRAGTVLYPSDQAVIMILDRHLGRRPIAYATSSGRRSWVGLEPLLVQRALVYEVFDGRPDTVPGFAAGLERVRVDTARTRALADEVFRYRGLFEADTLALDAAARQIASSLAAVYIELAQAQLGRGDWARALPYLRRANHLNPSRQLDEYVRRIEAEHR